MNPSEAKDIINILVATYPNAYKDQQSGTFDMIAKLWYSKFKNIDVKIVKRALFDAITEKTDNFPPAIGQVAQNIRDRISVFDAESQWENVMWIVRNVPEGLHKAPAKYLDSVSQMFVDEYYLRNLKNTSISEFDRKAFLDRYRKLQDDTERKAIDTGNILLMSTEGKLAQIGMTVKAIDVKHK